MEVETRGQKLRAEERLEGLHRVKRKTEEGGNASPGEEKDCSHLKGKEMKKKSRKNQEK